MVIDIRTEASIVFSEGSVFSPWSRDSPRSHSRPFVVWSVHVEGRPAFLFIACFRVEVFIFHVDFVRGVQIGGVCTFHHLLVNEQINFSSAKRRQLAQHYIFSDAFDVVDLCISGCFQQHLYGLFETCFEQWASTGAIDSMACDAH